ncbi:type II secretion system F family protein [Candidatus Gracilibacteria bacterium]|nr:type II secretion system F family protein [Candidatus Gracilibacteria bacterium]
MSDELLILDSKQEETGSTKKEGGQASFGLDKINEWLIEQQKINLKSKVIFFRLLATMVNAGISVLKSITILEKQEKNLVLKKLYTNIIDGIKGGKNLSNSLRDYNNNFSDSECSIIESGEKTGKLNSALIQLADQVEKVEGISKKFKGALIYPAAIIIVMFSVIYILMTLVVPKIVEIFGDKSKLPPITLFLIAVSDFFVNYGIYLIIGIIGFIIFISFWKKTPYGKYKFDKFILKIPIFGMINQKIILSKFARVLSNLLSSGISIVESLRIVSDIVGNEVYKQRILLLREDVKRGIKIGESLEDDSLFPDMLVQMIKVGEETAKLDTIIIKIADFYDDEVDQVINNIQKLLEPIIIVIMAVVVGFIAVGIMQPIMSLADIVSEG